eukprot:Selendium_serpulae@DN3386_c0_g1_i1.p2
MKADMYMKMFRNATDLDHVCRVPGVQYLRCLQDNYNEPQKARSDMCVKSFVPFEACRKGLMLQQETAMRDSLARQHYGDVEAKELFSLRNKLLDSVCGN